MITRRVNGSEELCIAASVGGKAGEFRFDGEYTDIISGLSYKNSIKLEAYEIYVLKRQ